MKEIPAKVIPFLVLNDRLDPEALRCFVRRAAGLGIDGVILHARDGLITPYLSEGWFEGIAACLEEARALGLEAWLYDEYPYPSGAAGGLVVSANPTFAERHLEIARFPLRGGGRREQVIGRHRVLHAFLVSAAGEKRGGALKVTSSVGLRHDTWIMRDWDSRYYYPTRHAEVYDCPRSTTSVPDWVFAGDVPEGEWELVAFQLITGKEYVEPFGYYIDVTNRAATSKFLELTHEAYRTRFGADFGGLIPGIFTDEPKLAHPFLWSEEIAANWRDYGEDPRALLSLLPEAKGLAARKNYRDTAMRLFTENWIRPISDWCRDNRLELCGHISPEEDWWWEARFAGSILKQLRHFAIPGCDLIIPAVGDRHHPVLNLTATLCVSAAAQTGAKYALCELFGASDYGLNLQDMKRIGDWLMALGINFFTPHGFFQSLNGYRKFDAPPTMMGPSTIEPFFADWSAHVQRVGSQLGPLGIATEVAIVRPMEHIRQLADSESPLAETWFASGIAIAQRLLEKAVPFHWVDDDDLAECRVVNGEVVYGAARYRTLVTIEDSLNADAGGRIERFKTLGIQVLSTAEAADTLSGSLVSCGAIRAVRTCGGAWFCLNLESQPADFVLQGQSYRLDGFESKVLDVDRESDSHEKIVLIPDERMMGRPLQPNTFRLGDWEINGAKRKLGPAYDIFGFEGVGIPTVFGEVPAEPCLKKTLEIRYQTTVTSARPSNLALCCEVDAMRGKWKAVVNGIALVEWQRSDQVAQRIWRHELQDVWRLGENSVEFSFSVDEVGEGLLEMPWIEGDFIVGPDQSILSRTSPLAFGDWTQLGFPHYSGPMCYECEFEMPKEAEGQVFLCFETPPADMAQVEINGQPVGKALWSPWEIEITRALQIGSNRLAITVTNTLVNRVYGRSRPSGLLGSARLVSRFYCSQPVGASRLS
ncbi:hypothetical protein BH09VER1_BH09VER1_51870 [soil metagenome]